MTRKLVPLFLLFVPACAPITQAERSTFEVIAPAHAAYVNADPTLDATAKQRRLDLLEAWRVRVGGGK